MSHLAKTLETCGETGRLIRSLDWSRTPLGPLDAWPEPMASAVSTALSCGFPASVILGRDHAHAPVVYNDAFTAFLGPKHPAAMGRSARELWTENWDFIDWALRQVRQTGRSVTGKDLSLLVDRGDAAEEIFASLSFSPVWDGAGEPCGALMIGIETTAAVVGERRERLLRQLSARLVEARTEDEVCQLVAAELSAGAEDIAFALLYLLDDGGASAVLRAAAGVDPAAAPLGKRVALDTAGTPLCDLAWAARSREVRLVTPTCVRLSPMGSMNGVPRLAAIVPVMSSPADRLLGLLALGVSPTRPFDEAYDGFFRLVAHRIASALWCGRRIQEARRQAEAAAESRLKDVFLGLASHELRTPLTCLKLNVQLVHQKLRESDPRLAERIAGLGRSIDRMTRLVDEMLTISAISAGRLSLRPARCDLRDLCRSAAAEVGQATRRDIALDLPEAPVEVVADADRLGQVVANLLSNALKYSAVDRPVILALHAGDHEATVTVRDRGAGIPPESLPHIFERFYRAPGVDIQSGSYQGLGLGLFLSKVIVEQHAGRIWAESALGEGSAFSFSVPLAA